MSSKSTSNARNKLKSASENRSVDVYKWKFCELTLSDSVVPTCYQFNLLSFWEVIIPGILQCVCNHLPYIFWLLILKNFLYILFCPFPCKSSLKSLPSCFHSVWVCIVRNQTPCCCGSFGHLVWDSFYKQLIIVFYKCLRI